MAAAAAGDCWKHEEREAFKDAERHVCVRKLAGLPQGILMVTDRLRLVV